MNLLWVRQEWDENLNDGQSPSVETLYQVMTDNMEYPILSARLDLLTELTASGALVFGNLPLTDIKIERLRASKCFRARVTYGMRSLPEDGKFDFSMDSRPEQRKMFMSLGTVATYVSPGALLKNTGGLLGVNSDQTATGSELFVPTDTMNFTVWWALARFIGGQPVAAYRSLQNYVDLIETLVGSVNSTTFTITARGLTWTYLPGECLFASRKLSQQAGDLWQLDFEFRIKRNYIDPTITAWLGVATTVEGWNELEFATEPKIDPGSAGLTAGAFSAEQKLKYLRKNLNLLKVPAPP